MDAVTQTDRLRCKKRTRPLRWLGPLIVLLLVARLHLIVVRLYDPDEFEHLHAGYCVAQGLLPYRDFFEHHGPATYYLSAILVRVFGAELKLLTVHRLVSLVFVLAALLGTWKMARRLFGRVAALVAVSWVLTCPWFAEKSVEWRPDVPAMALATWAVWLLACKRGSGLAAFLAGLLFGLGTLFTQKTAALMVGVIVGVVAQAIAAGRPVRRPLALAAAGWLAPWMLFVTWFAVQSALMDFARCIVWHPLTWPRDVHDSAADLRVQLLSSKDWAPGHQGLAALALICGLGRLPKRSALIRGEAITLLGVTTHLVSAITAPAAYLQHYLVALPLLAVLAGGTVVRLSIASRRIRRARGFARRRFLLLPVIAATGALGIGLVVPTTAHDEPRWRRLGAIAGDIPAPTDDPYGWVDRTGVGFVVLAGAATIVHRRVGAGFVWLALFIPSLGRVLIPHQYWSNELQLSDLRQVHEAVPANGRVLDGFTGLGCLRPHVGYWWWINDYSTRLMGETGMYQVIHALSSGIPDAVLYDRYLAHIVDAPGWSQKWREGYFLRENAIWLGSARAWLLPRSIRAPPSSHTPQSAH
jgi:4-amino-4-deoxy-L-arabinose transferase-like glycosyltransferase